MIDGTNFLDQPINNDYKTHENTKKIPTGKGNNYTTGFLLDYPYFKENYKIVAIDLTLKWLGGQFDLPLWFFKKCIF